MYQLLVVCMNPAFVTFFGIMCIVAYAFILDIEYRLDTTNVVEEDKDL